MNNRRLIHKLKSAFALGITAVMLTTGLNYIAPFHAAAADDTVASTSQKRTVMYYGDWSIWGGQGNFYPQDIPADQLTHLNFSFLDFDAQGNLIYTDEGAAIAASLNQEGVTWGGVNAGILPALINLRAVHPNLKIGVSIGGWSKSGDFTAVASNPTIRKKFIENLMRFIEYTDMDYIDVDWEYPTSVREPDKVDNINDEGTLCSTPADKANYIILLQEMRNALDIQGAKLGKTYEISVALPAPISKLSAGIDVDALFEIVDFANVMSYDMRGAWDSYSGHQASLYPNPADPYASSELSISEAVDYLLSNGAPADKIVVGSAFYTRGWGDVEAGDNPDTPGLFGYAEIAGQDADQTSSRGAKNELPLASGSGGRLGGVWSYRSLDKLKAAYPDLEYHWDDVAKAPYLYGSTSKAFFTYDNVQSITEKANYVNANNLGGIIGWMASQDKPSVSGSLKRDELTNAMKEGIFGSAELPIYDIAYAELDITAGIETSTGSNNQEVFTVTINNNEAVNESGSVLTSTERIAETVFIPKFYIQTSADIVGGDYRAGTVTREGDYVVVDLQSVYDARTIAQGDSYIFSLTANGSASPADIHSIELIQRTKIGGAEYARQTIHGQIGAPVIRGVSNKTIELNSEFDSMEGVTAYDKIDGDITSAIQVQGSVDTKVEGDYKLTYSVTNSEGVTTTISCIITVGEDGTDPEDDTYDPTKIYVAGDVVTYNGNKYRAKWWTQGDIPGENMVWELIS